MKKLCPFCKKNKYHASHLYFCAKQHGIILSNDDIKFKYIKYNYPKINKNILYKEYISNKKSLPDIRKKYKLDYKSILFLLSYWNIKNRSATEAICLAQEKIQKTCLEKYGDTNVLGKKSPIYIKRNKTILEKYGVLNIFQNKDIVEKIKIGLKKGGNSYEKRMKTMMERYGVKGFGGYVRSKGSISNFNKNVYKILKDNDIDYQPEFWLRDEKNKIYFYDIKIKNIILELHGDYWHCNPKIFNKNFYNKSLKMYAEEKWKYDLNKKKLAIKRGYDYIVIWENDFNKNKGVVNEIIENKINKSY